ncbi:MAG: Rpn family recombination-promoting nuclease/putative transposase, partial [Planctomycetaceae bacterium]|nr:Rpn family recombination-promoting nuclease/putative transposase [Planctomycetaceae bacterium]
NDNVQEDNAQEDGVTIDMYELSHPHDLLTRGFLVDVELMASMLKNYGGKGIVKFIDLSKLRCETTTVVDGKLKEKIGDLRFSTKFKRGNHHSRIFLFFEHQSKKSKKFFLRTLEQIVQFYMMYDAAGGKYPFPVVVVLYSGQIPWNELLQLRDFIDTPPGVDPNVLYFPVVLIDLTQIPRDRLKGHPAVVALFDALQSSSFGDLNEGLPRIVGHIGEVKTDRRAAGWLSSLISYFLANPKVEKSDVAGALSKILSEKEANEMYNSVLAKNYLEGKAEGEIKAKADNVVKSLTIRFKKVPASVSKSVNSFVDLVALDSLFEYAITCNSIEEFKKELSRR